MRRWTIVFAGLLAACRGNAWTDADTKAASDVIRAQSALVDLCDGDDGGSCTPGAVRAVNRSTLCNLGSMAARHGADVTDGGAGCR